ncbi:MAG: Kae1-associated serine/threonine protein kinase [Candidatus Marsarchaeota archaeon]|nr:Kae1-associated serine/threonine protein kinase [Candidatus Marsarchaeota archaeon]
MKISNGAEANVYRSNILGIDCVVKVRQKKLYRIQSLDNQIREQRTKIEARILALAHSRGIAVPPLFLVSKYGITMGFINGILLSKIDGNKSVYLKEAGILLGKLHNNNICHGDFTTANIMVFENKLFIIDFGLSEIIESVEQKALDILLMKRSIGQKSFSIFISSYKKSSKGHKLIIKKLNELETRGRYQQRSLQNI